jgi:hypothetical protein
MKTILYLFLSVLVFGCNKKVEDKIPDKISEKKLEYNINNGKTNVNISGNGNTESIEINDGDSKIAAGTAAKIPESFPADVVVFKPSEVIMSAESSTGYTLGLKTDKGMDVVTAEYKKVMVDNGWSQKTAADMGQYSILGFKKDRRTATISVNKEANMTKIMIIIALNKN